MSQTWELYSGGNWLLTGLPLYHTEGLIYEVVFCNTTRQSEERAQIEWWALATVNTMRWRHGLVHDWNPKLSSSEDSTVGPLGTGSGVWCWGAWPLSDQRDVIFGVWHRRGGGDVEGDGREQGMRIKSALILNYSRDKNPGLKRSAGNSASPSSLVKTF